MALIDLIYDVFFKFSVSFDKTPLIFTTGNNNSLICENCNNVTCLITLITVTSDNYKE